ncbi:MAG: AraC family transcriptional regulator [Chthoniobacteraceae bacterium]
MASPAASLAETHIVGTETREWKVRAAECPPLALHHIAHVGVADAAAPYEMVRLDLGGTYFLSCSAGKGRILLDGRWQLIREGWACLAPPHALLAFQAVKGARWEFVWVRYQQQAGQKPLLSSSSPALAKFDPQPLRHAVLGLVHEMQSRTAPVAVSHWVELIHTYVRRFAQPWQTDDRLGHLWEFVATRLGEPWSLDRLAQKCHLSTEHLRRLCRRELGRSPMHHVIFLRMQSAAKLLATTNDKIETIATEVGYENPFVFSTTFKKWVGWRPSEYRARQR